MKCRICGSTKNLKYTQAEIRNQNKSKRLPLPLKEIANAINGNICKFCDLRLQNFHHEENESSGIQENVNEVPIFVDDDERLFNIFYKRQHSGAVMALGSDGTEVIEVFTSREASPELSPTFSNNNNNSKDLNEGIISNGNAKVVDIIELEDDDDVDIDGKTVETVTKTKSPLKNVQQETRLLGCLSLVTSDSDSEINFEPCRKVSSKKDKDSKTTSSNKTEEESNSYVSKDDSITIQHTLPVCKICGIRLLDSKTLERHMQEHQRKLSCPACECQFSADLSLVYICRHLLTKHKDEYAMYIKELTDYSLLGVSNKALREIQYSARVLKLIDNDEQFFECRLCFKVFGTAKSFLRHLNGHNNDEWTQFKNSKASIPIEDKKRSKRKTEDFPLKISKQNEKHSLKNESECKEKPQTNKLTNKKSLSPKESKLKNDDRIFKKPLKQINSVVKSNDGNRQKKLKRRTKNNGLLTKGITKVKAKAPLRHFPTQKYNCKHCQIKGKNCQFKGFRKLQLHLIYSHQAEEFKEHHFKSSTSKLTRKRKYNTTNAGVCNGVDNGQVDVNFNTDSKIQSLKSSQIQDFENPSSEPPTWLTEIYRLSREKKKREFNHNTATDTAVEDEILDNFSYSYQQFQKTAEHVCLYCACLLSKPIDIAAHEKLHIESKDMPWIKFCRIQQDSLGTNNV